MKKTPVVFPLLAAGLMLFATPLFAAEPADTPETIARCFRAAGSDTTAFGKCLKRERAVVKAEYKNAVEKMTILAKRWDKPNRNRVRWEQLMRANQAFDNYVKRECRFVENTTVGNRTAEENAKLACEINLYRMRTDFLEGRVTADEK